MISFTRFKTLFHRQLEAEVVLSQCVSTKGPKQFQMRVSKICGLKE